MRCVHELNQAGLLVYASLLMVYLLLVRTWQSVKRSLKSSREALCFAPRGSPQANKLGGSGVLLGTRDLPSLKEAFGIAHYGASP